ncbi:MAG: hypothetical protein ACRKGH_04250 [Dehalogenimonas sp.]
METNEFNEKKPVGDVELAVQNTFPMIDQIAAQARIQAQRAGTLAMHEYRRKLQGIVLDMQDSVRDEGAKLAEQIRQAVLLQAEEKALDLVDEFIHGRQAEADNLVRNLLIPEEQIETEKLELDEAPVPVPVNEFPVAKDESEAVVADAKAGGNQSADKTQDNESAPKGAFDFASFISRPQS